MPTPISRYQADQQTHGFSPDAAQAQAVQHLQKLYEALVDSKSPTNFITRLVNKAKPNQPQGLYIWGGVGRGKTYLMDLFYDCLPIPNKLRTHFHKFMRDVHQRLSHYQGTKNPLDRVAKDIANQAQIICFDEFFVTDITDAMILSGLLQALIQRQVILVATSNIEPSKLYKNGLQRQRFLPTIDLLQQNTQVINLDGGTDYRLRTLVQADLYHCPLGAEATNSLANSFSSLAPVPNTHTNNTSLLINNRSFMCHKRNNDVIWFDFKELCEQPRSQNDYLEIASEYRAILIDKVPQLSRDKDDAAKRFINLVDVCYDASVKLIIAAQVPLLELYVGGQLSFPFQRTLSRLQEMQSQTYLAQAHIPLSGK